MNIGFFKSCLLLSYIAVASASAALITPALPAIAQHFVLTQSALTWVVTIFLLGYMAGQLLYGPLANRWGRLYALRLGFGINLVGIIICLIAVSLNSYTLLLVGRLITALGAAAGLSCTFMLIHAFFTPEKSKSLLSYAVIAFTLGIGLAVLAGGLITQYSSWQNCFWLLFLHGLLVLLSTWLFQEPHFEKKNINLSTLSHGYGTALKSRKLLVFSCLLGFVSVVSYTYSAAAPMIAHQLLGLSSADYAYWNSINMIGMLAGGFSAAKILQCYGTTHVLYIALAAMVLCLLILVVMACAHYINTLGFFSITMLMYFFTSWIFPAASFMATHDMADRASGSSMMSFINMCAAALSVFVMGMLPFNMLTNFIVILSLYLVSALVFFGLAPRNRSGDII